MPDVLLTGYDPSSQRVVVVFGSLGKLVRGGGRLWCVDVVWDDGGVKRVDELCIDRELMVEFASVVGDLRRGVRRFLAERLGVVEVVSP